MTDPNSPTVTPPTPTPAPASADTGNASAAPAPTPTPAAAPADVNSAPPSSAGDGVKPAESLADAVLGAFKDVKFEEDDPNNLDALLGTPPKADGVSPAPEANAPAKSADVATPAGSAGVSPVKDAAATAEGNIDLSADPTEAELAAYTPRAQQRIRELVTRAKNAEAFASEFSDFDAYMKDYRLKKEDVTTMLGLTAALQTGDFKTFLAGVVPYVQFAQQQLGLMLPADLQQQVRQGRITEALARELAQQRAANRLSSVKTRQMQSDHAAMQDQARRTQFKDAVNNWEASTRSTDPDYGKKQPLVERFTKALLRDRGMPRTPEEAVSMAKLAYDEATKYVTGLAPKPPQPTPMTPGTGKSPTPVKSEPGSLMEAAIQGLRSATG